MPKVPPKRKTGTKSRDSMPKVLPKCKTGTKSHVSMPKLQYKRQTVMRHRNCMPLPGQVCKKMSDLAEIPKGNTLNN